MTIREQVIKKMAENAKWIEADDRLWTTGGGEEKVEIMQNTTETIKN